jgi:hypothetical protein
MAKEQWKVIDGPLEGELFALEMSANEQISLKLPDGRVAVYRADLPKRARLFYVGIDPVAPNDNIPDS